MERKKVSGKYTKADHSYILKSANLTCSRQVSCIFRFASYSWIQSSYLLYSTFVLQKKLCCEDEYYRGIDELTNQSCGKCGTIKVYGGIEILLMSRPWMALLETRQPLQNDSSFTCGGTLIHKRKQSHSLNVYYNMIYNSCRLCIDRGALF